MIYHSWSDAERRGAMLRRGVLCLSYNLHLNAYAYAERRGAMLRRGVLCLSYNLHLKCLKYDYYHFGAMLRGEEQC